MGLHSKIGTFGDVAAEQDAVLTYFLKTEAVNSVECGSVVVVLGRKGSGKTAISTYFNSSNDRYISVSLSLRDYPWSLHEKRINLGASDIESYVTSWRYLVAVRVLSLLLSQCGMKSQTDSQKAAYNFLYENYGGISPSLQDILRPKRLKLSKASFAPSIMGNSLGGVDLEGENGGLAHEADALTDVLIECAQTIASQVGRKKFLFTLMSLIRVFPY